MKKRHKWKRKRLPKEPNELFRIILESRQDRPMRELPQMKLDESKGKIKPVKKIEVGTTKALTLRDALKEMHKRAKNFNFEEFSYSSK